VTFSSIATIIAGGFLPPLLWLFFLLKEDSRNPEPKRIIALAFFAGMICVPLAIPLEMYTSAHITGQFLHVVSWATIEEMLKYTAAALLILWRPAVDEPLDYVIYLITVALGFAALENVLFIFSPIVAGNIAGGMVTDGLRFMGANVLHVIASATIGFAFAFSYAKPPVLRMLYASVGVILAISLHTAFNLLIIDRGGLHTFEAFLFAWSGLIVILALFEVVKYRTYHNLPAHVR